MVWNQERSSKKITLHNFHVDATNNSMSETTDTILKQLRERPSESFTDLGKNVHVRQQELTGPLLVRQHGQANSWYTVVGNDCLAQQYAERDERIKALSGTANANKTSRVAAASALTFGILAPKPEAQPKASKRRGASSARGRGKAPRRATVSQRIHNAGSSDSDDAIDLRGEAGKEQITAAEREIAQRKEGGGAARLLTRTELMKEVQREAQDDEQHLLDWVEDDCGSMSPGALEAYKQRKYRGFVDEQIRLGRASEDVGGGQGGASSSSALAAHKKLSRRPKAGVSLEEEERINKVNVPVAGSQFGLVVWFGGLFF